MCVWRVRGLCTLERLWWEISDVVRVGVGWVCARCARCARWGWVPAGSQFILFQVVDFSKAAGMCVGILESQVFWREQDCIGVRVVFTVL